MLGFASFCERCYIVNMTVIRKFFETLDNTSLDDIDVPLVILITVIIIILAFKFGKKDDGKTIFTGSEEYRRKYENKSDHEGFI
jgi:hypothetical protein